MNERLGVATMYSLLVLGLISGTNIQISFWAWIIIMATLIVAFKLLHKRIANFLIDWWKRLDQIEGVRRPLHANQLHSRLHLTVR